MTNILKQDIIAAHLRVLYKEIRALKRAFTVSEREGDLGAAEEPQDGNFLMDQRFIGEVVQVTSLVDEHQFAALRTIPTSLNCLGWALDSEFSAKPLVVTKTPTGVLPSVGDCVNVFFTGTYGSSPAIPQPRYGFFGGSGGALQEYVVMLTGNDHVVAVSTATTIDTANHVNIAKPHILRLTPFDGNTIDGLAYNYNDENERIVTRISDSEQQTQVIVPTYLSSFSVIYAIGVPNLNIFVNSIELSLMDINADARMWAETVT